jgi:hypothetical protein
VQTLNGEFYVVGYSRVCATPDCACFGQHYHASGHLKVSLPYSTYGLDVLAQVGNQRRRHHKQFIEECWATVSPVFGVGVWRLAATRGPSSGGSQTVWRAGSAG